MSDVFVSYKAEDRARVEPLVDALEAEGLTVWWDARVSGGEAWRETIAKQLDDAGCVIVVWSKRSTGPDGRFVRDEANRALRRGIYLPITIDKVDPPLGFGETQALALRGWKGDPSDPRYRAISDCVYQLLGKERQAPTAPPATPRTRAGMDRRTAMATGGVAAVLAAAAGGWFLLRSTRANANTIAVLPFANLSGDRSEDYFSDGVAEEVRAALAALGSLHVVARTSSEMLRNTDVVTAARRLDVANVVTGSVRRSPSTVRVAAQLVDGKSGLERWSQSFDRPLGDVLQIQSDIAANVARALSIELGASSAQRGSLGGTRDAGAQDLLLQATATEGDDSSASQLRRIQLLDRATKLDPNYAEAFARKALTQTIWANSWAGDNAEKNRVDKEAFGAARRAIAIAPDMPLGYSALGLIHFNELQMTQSLQVLSRSVELPGADTLAFVNYGSALCRFRRQSEAESMIARATSLDPLNPVAWVTKAWIVYLGRRYPEAIEAARQALRLAPENRRAKTLIAWSFVLQGKRSEAANELQHVPSDDYRRLVGEGVAAARWGRREDALRTIESLKGRYGDTVSYQLAQVYAQVGENDKAISELEAAWTKRDAGLASLQVDPFLDPLRKDPRFVAIARRVFG